MIGRPLTLAVWMTLVCVAPGCRPEASRELPEIGEDALDESDSQNPLSEIAEQFRAVRRAATRADRPFSFGPRFSQVAGESGVDHVYRNGAVGELLMVEPTGGGCGWIDFDRDGAWDLYLNQGGDATAPPSAAQPSDQLFRNLGTGQFNNVTQWSGIDERGYSQGVAIGDYDNDGFDDILVTNVGINTLFRNQGDGTFLDVSKGTFGGDRLWSSSAAWGDIDLDGDLDVYVCRYVDFDPFHPQECLNAKGLRIMCQPNQVEPVADECYLNLGDGTFRPVAQERGLMGPGNKALGVAIADFDNDGWPDIYVANDATPNFLFINQRNGQFVEQAGLLGCAVAAEGRSQASMGVAVGDYDRNGYLDLYLTHFEGEWNTLYRNLGPEGFRDVTGLAGLVQPTLPMVGFGTVLADFNQDGQDDLFVANGHLDDPGHLGIDLEMRPQCFSFDGKGKWMDNSSTGGDYFAGRYIGRGVAAADYDNDGDLDLAVVHQNQPAALLRNDSRRWHWLKLSFVGRRCNRNGVGVRVIVRSENGERMQELAGGLSYCSASQPVLIFGLESSRLPCRVEIRWPGGETQVLDEVDVDQSLLLVEPPLSPAESRQ
ncbi:MAG: CRTAC1 family protein [Planctomycetales bacterium]